MHPIGVTKMIMFEVLLAGMKIPCSVELFRIFYKVYKSGDWFTIEQRERDKDWKLIAHTPTSMKRWRFEFVFVDTTCINLWTSALFAWKTNLAKELNNAPHLTGST